MDAASRERGLEHAENCASCATFLAEERALSARLRALSVEAGAEEIPARIETALLTAFRRQVNAPAAPSGRRRWLLAVAALALLTLGLSMARWITSSPARESAGPDSIAGKSDDSSKCAIAPTPAPFPASMESSEPAAPQIVPVQRDRRQIAGSTTENRQKRLSATGDISRRSINDIPHEIVTRFFPVAPGNELIPLESGQIVRVRMPRSNLIPLGIPISQERAYETIQADVLVSNDGLARAIRLVY